MEKVFKSLGITNLVWDSPLDVKRIANGKIVTNDFMFELYKSLKDSGKQFSVFYKVISNLVPCDTFEKIAVAKAAAFCGRINQFLKKACIAQKNATKREKFMQDECSFTLPEKEDLDTSKKKHLKEMIKDKDNIIKKIKLDSAGCKHLKMICPGQTAK